MRKSCFGFGTAKPKDSALQIWCSLVSFFAAAPLRFELAAGPLALSPSGGRQLLRSNTLTAQRKSRASAEALASTGGNPLATAASAGLGGALSTFSTGAGLGSAGLIITAGAELLSRSGKGKSVDDITGDRAVRDLIARTKGQYY